MFGTLLFTLVGLSLAGFMVNRLYVGIRERQLDVKVSFTRDPPLRSGIGSRCH
jgi:hypothetical protein